MSKCVKPKYQETHDYLLYTYDVIADMIRQADSKKLVQVEIDIPKNDYSPPNSDDLFEWLDENDMHDYSIKLFRSHTFFSLLKDFCFFLYESLSAIERGKVTVAYSLLRKPIKDNLLYLEWLLADEESFYNSLLFEDINMYDITNKASFPEKRIKDIIEKAGSKSYMGSTINTNNMLYDFRFNSKQNYSLQRIWNQAMHIVTAAPTHKTEKGNLNFIFSDEEIWEDFWNYYYLIMPQIMAYILEICEAIFCNICDINKFDVILNRQIRFYKYTQIMSVVYKQEDSLNDFLDKESTISQFTEILKDSSVHASIKCDNCERQIALSHQILSQLLTGFFIKCPICHNEQNSCRYINGIQLEPM